MSGLEPVLIGAAIGGGTSAAMGGDPLQGALMGGITGGAASGLGGLAAGASSGAASGAAGGVAQAFPVALESSITSSLLPQVAGGASSILPSAVPHVVSGNLLGQMGAMDLAQASLGQGFAQTSGQGGLQGLLGSMDMSKLSPMMGQMGGAKPPSQMQDDLSAPPIRRGQAPNITDPLEELMRQQSGRRSAGRPISLL